MTNLPIHRSTFLCVLARCRSCKLLTWLAVGKVYIMSKDTVTVVFSLCRSSLTNETRSRKLSMARPSLRNPVSRAGRTQLVLSHHRRWAWLIFFINFAMQYVRRTWRKESKSMTDMPCLKDGLFFQASMTQVTIHAPHVIEKRKHIRVPTSRFAREMCIISSGSGAVDLPATSWTDCNFHNQNEQSSWQL